MAVAFSRTLKSVDADKSRITTAGIALTAILAGVWTYWMVHASVPVFAVSDYARIEADGAVRQVQTLQAGRIVRMHMTVGQQVKAGDLLAELDTTTQRMQAQEERSAGEANGVELRKIEQEIASERSALDYERHAATIANQEARTKLREAETALSFAELEVKNKGKLRDSGLAPDIEVAKATSEAERQRAIVDGLRLSINRQEEEQKAQASEHQSRIDALMRDASRLQGEQRRSGMLANRLQTEIALQQVLAPVDGKIGELAPLRVGSVVGPGDKLGAIVPSGKLKIVAGFKPATAVGRVRAGQLARVKFEGFPWPQYGTMSARVSRVANELRDGYVFVDLEPLPGSRIPIQHGLPGATEVEVERVSPAELVLRSAGEMMKGRKSPAPEQTQQGQTVVVSEAR